MNKYENYLFVFEMIIVVGIIIELVYNSRKK